MIESRLLRASFWLTRFTFLGVFSLLALQTLVGTAVGAASRAGPRR